MYGSLDISTSALIAQRTRMDVISANVANKSSLFNDAGEYEPYRRRTVLFGVGDPKSGSKMGVHIAAIELDQSELMKKYQPSSPYADDDGYVLYPNVNTVIETMNAMEAARSYEANITAIEATKAMMSAALRIIA